MILSRNSFALAPVTATLGRRASTASGRPAPLEGIKIIDFTTGLAGPFTTQMLGDLGADIVKIEGITGDPARKFGPCMPATTRRASPESTLFLAANRNKRSVQLDLRSTDGHEAARKLVQVADVVVNSWIPAESSSLKLDYERLRSINPKLIYCSITGYGQTGPYKNHLSNDGIIAAETGITYCTGVPDRPPVRPEVAVTDHVAAYHGVGAVMAAILCRDRTGKGINVDVSGFDAQVASLGNVGGAYLNGEMEYVRVGTAHPTVVPYEVFATADGCLMIGTGNNSQFDKLAAAIDRMDLCKDPRFCTNPLRVKNRDIIVPILTELIIAHPTEYWVTKFTGKGFPFGAINNMEATFKHPQALSRSLVAEAMHSGVGKVRMVKPPVLYNGERMKIRRPAPQLGEHTAEVLSEYLEADVAKAAATLKHTSQMQRVPL